MNSKNYKYFFCDDKGNAKSLISDILSFLAEEKISLHNILTIIFFIDSSKEEFVTLRERIKEDLNERNISLPVAIVAQAVFQSHIAAEIFYITGDFQNIKSCEDYKLIKSDYGYELFGVVSSDKWINQSDDVFDKLEKILNTNNFEINQIIRQWNYIEDILKFSECEQNYQRFNNARSRFYSKTQWDKGYPAATGIGTNAGGVIVCFHAIRAKENVRVVTLKNPNQIDAHQYSDKVLVGENQKATPKFERGKLIIYHNQFDVLVSGTAAILGEEAEGNSNAEQQTLTTISNIDNVVDSCQLTVESKAVLDVKRKYSNVRVYIKNHQDFEIIHKICNKHYPNTEIIYLQADICREELLVEIEANCFGLKVMGTR